VLETALDLALLAAAMSSLAVTVRATDGSDGLW
jgi:hypothetical protein